MGRLKCAPLRVAAEQAVAVDQAADNVADNGRQLRALREISQEEGGREASGQSAKVEIMHGG
jgi:hypothetical protein